MRIAKIIREQGTKAFQDELNNWLRDNQDVTIISISTSETVMTIPSGNKQIMAIGFTAVIIYDQPV